MSELAEQLDAPVVEAPVTEQTPTEAPAPQLSKEQVELIQKKAYGYAMQHLDQALEEMGYKKPEGVKSTEYVKQILTEAGTKKDTSSVNDTVADADFKARFEQLRVQLSEKEQLIESLKESTTAQKRDFFLNSIVDTAQVTAPDYLGDQEKQRYEQRVRNLIRDGLKSNFSIKEVDDTFRFYTKEGEPIFDGTPDMNPIKPSELLAREFSEFFVKPQQTSAKVAGTGGLQEGATAVQTSAGVIPSNIQDRYQFYSYLTNTKKMVTGSPEFMEQVNKARKERPSMFK
jgi:hypothetical protein